MAEVAKSVVSEPDRPEPEEVSLQELIENELALRVPSKTHVFTRDFLLAEREAACQDHPAVNGTVVTGDGEEWTTVESVAMEIQGGVDANGHDEIKMVNGDSRKGEFDQNGDRSPLTNGQHSLTGSPEPPMSDSAIAKSPEPNTGTLIDFGETAQNSESPQTNGDVEQIPDFSHGDVPSSNVLTNGKDHVSFEDDSVCQTVDGPEIVVSQEEHTTVEGLSETVTTVTTTVKTVISSVVGENETESVETTVTEKKKKKKSASENGEIVTNGKVKKTKKKKTEEKENHISVKSSFSKFDQLSKKSTVLHVRSSDAAKASKTFSQGATETANPNCKACNKTVFAMEQIKAERAVWHKNCFRCHTCNKQLTVDIYSSHEGELYCKPHFKELFKPKAVVEDEEPASDKPDLGLEELSSLNVKSRFQVFEKGDNVDGELERSPTQVSVKRSSSILSKLAKFQKKGMDVGVTDDALNGYVYEETSSSEEDEDEDDEEQERGVIKCRRKQKERPMSFGKIDDVKKNWESATDQTTRREMMREMKKEELQNLRSRLFMGKQGKMKELYEQAVAESEGGKTARKDSDSDIVRSENAKLVKEKFEKGEIIHSESDEEGRNKKTLNEDMSVFEEGISKKSRSIFLEMDATVAKSASTVQVAPQPPKEVKPRQPRETDSPEREIYRDPMVVRCEDKLEDETILKSQTTSKMLSMFRQLEEQKEVVPDGPKPKKCFTPPPDARGSESEEESEEEYDEDEEDDDEEEEESEGEDGVVKSSYKVKDEFLEQARNAAKARQLAAKFEQWEPEKHSANNAVSMLDSEHASLESTKSLKAKFESFKSDQPVEKARPKVNRFVEPPAVTLCSTCEQKVYPLEKIETDGKIFHKQCFRCSYCNCILRMESYTLNNGQLYCLTHFKQLFITKGNYDEGFGSNQHKRKWETPAN